MNRVALIACVCAVAVLASAVFADVPQKAGDALFKMRATDNSEVVRNVYIPITPGAAMGWDSTGTPAALPMPTPFRIPVGTPKAGDPGTDGDTKMDANYIYTYLAGSWKKTIRTNL